MYEAYNKLVDNAIKVYSVKSDAYTIHEDDLTRVMGKPNHYIYIIISDWKICWIGQQLHRSVFKNVLFVVPHSRLSQEIEGDATTYNMFFRIPVHKEDELPEFHHSNFDVIFFDEIYMTNLYIYI